MSLAFILSVQPDECGPKQPLTLAGPSQLEHNNCDVHKQKSHICRLGFFFFCLFFTGLINLTGLYSTLL